MVAVLSTLSRVVAVSATDVAMRARHSPRMANHLRAWREYRGLSQTEVGERLGSIHKTTISKVESRPRIGSDWLEKLAGVYGVNQTELLGPPPMNLVVQAPLNVSRAALVDRFSEALTKLVRDGVPLPGWPEILADSVLDELRPSETQLPIPEARVPRARAGSRATTLPSAAKTQRKTP